MENVEITIQTILALCGGITCILAATSAIAKLFNPFKTLVKRVDEQDAKLKRDFDRINQMEKYTQDIDESNKVICKSLLVLLNHTITGNGIDRLKEQRDDLEQYLINR